MKHEEAKALIDRAVVYVAHPGALPEQGTITGVGSSYVFVRYGADAGSKATRAEHLELVGSAS